MIIVISDILSKSGARRPWQLVKSDDHGTELANIPCLCCVYFVSFSKALDSFFIDTAPGSSYFLCTITHDRHTKEYLRGCPRPDFRTEKPLFCLRSAIVRSFSSLKFAVARLLLSGTGVFQRLCRVPLLPIAGQQGKKFAQTQFSAKKCHFSAK